MLPALRAALESGTGDAEPEAVRRVVFVTDGQVGNEDQLFRDIHERLGRRSRLTTRACRGRSTRSCVAGVGGQASRAWARAIRTRRMSLVPSPIAIRGASR
jgi:hypothetical protein